MTPAIIISAAALVCTMLQVFFTWRRDKRSNKKDDTDEAARSSILMLKLDMIQGDTSAIKSDVREIKSTQEKQERSIAVLEQKVKALEHEVFGHHK